MSKSPAEFLKHILEEINYVQMHCENIDETKFSQDPTLQRAFVRSLEIIGQATKNLPTDFTTKYPDINWKDMAGMRDRLIHGYFGVDYEIVWDVAKNELPSLKPKIEEIIILATAEE
jgi:uncharacterized protein with HEPN domain